MYIVSSSSPDLCKKSVPMIKGCVHVVSFALAAQASIAGQYDYHELKSGPSAKCGNTATVHGWVSKKELNITKVSEGVFSVTPDVCGQIPNVVKWVPSSDEETLSKQCGGQTVKIQHHEDPGHVHLEVTVEDCVHEVRSAIVIIYDVCCVRG